MVVFSTSFLALFKKTRALVIFVFALLYMMGYRLSKYEWCNFFFTSHSEIESNKKQIKTEPEKKIKYRCNDTVCALAGFELRKKKIKSSFCDIAVKPSVEFCNFIQLVKQRIIRDVPDWICCVGKHKRQPTNHGQLRLSKSQRLDAMSHCLFKSCVYIEGDTNEALFLRIRHVALSIMYFGQLVGSRSFSHSRIVWVRTHQSWDLLWGSLQTVVLPFLILLLR